MICPCEKKGETSVVDSRPTEDGTAIRRRRLCACGERFTFNLIKFLITYYWYKKKSLVRKIPKNKLLIYKI